MPNEAAIPLPQSAGSFVRAKWIRSAKIGTNNVPHITHRCAPRVMYMKFGTMPPACESKPMKKGRYRT